MYEYTSGSGFKSIFLRDNEQEWSLSLGADGTLYARSVHLEIAPIHAAELRSGAQYRRQLLNSSRLFDDRYAKRDRHAECRHQRRRFRRGSKSLDDSVLYRDERVDRPNWCCDLSLT